MGLRGKTASRFLLSAARIVLTDEQFTNGYLPDFRGEKEGRVAIPQESVDKLRGFLIIIFILSFKISFAEAVRKRFSFKEEDMNSIWNTIRTSLVQKVTDIRKKERKSQQQQNEQDNRNRVSAEANCQGVNFK